MYNYDPPTPSRQRPTEDGGSSSLVMGIAVGAGAMAVIALVAVVLLRFLGQGTHDAGTDAPAVAAAEEASAEEASTPQEQKKQPDGAVKPKNRRILLTRPVTAKPAASAAKQPPASKPAVAAPAPGAAANNPQQAAATAPSASATPSPAAPATVVAKPFQPAFDALPKAVDLPSLAESTNIDKPVSLGKLEVPEEVRCQMTLVHGIKEEMRPYQFNVGTQADQPRVWQISMSEKAPNLGQQAAEPKQPTDIAQLKLESDELFFQWLPDCVNVPADSLRNALLWVQVADKKHRLHLRKPAVAAPVVLDLEETAQDVSFSTLALPPLEALQLELLEFTAPASVPAQRPQRVRGDDSLRLVVHRGPPAFELRLQLEVEEGKADVRVEPCLVDTDGEVIPLTITDITTMQKELPLEIRRTEKELEDVREARANSGQRIALTTRSLNPKQANSQLAALRTSLEKLVDKERTLAQRVPVLQQRRVRCPIC